jgi:hypothetical protein
MASFLLLLEKQVVTLKCKALKTRQQRLIASQPDGLYRYRINIVSHFVIKRNVNHFV